MRASPGTDIVLLRPAERSTTFQRTNQCAQKLAGVVTRTCRENGRVRARPRAVGARSSRAMPSSKTAAKPASSHADEFDSRIVRALSHPVRHRVLVALNERVASPKELAAELGEPLGNVSYHTRVLAQLGCIELVSTTQRRGALEHYYRAVMRPYFDDAAWARIPVSTRRALFDQDLEHLWQDV